MIKEILKTQFNLWDDEWEEYRYLQKSIPILLRFVVPFFIVVIGLIMTFVANPYFALFIPVGAGVFYVNNFYVKDWS